MIPLSKQLADFITWTRALLVPFFLWLGFESKRESLPLVIILMILDWTGDSVDGALARRKPIPYQTWIGRHDLEVDMLVSGGLLAYMTSTRLIGWPFTIFYLIFWLLLFWRRGVTRTLGMLFQAPIYGWFIYVAIREFPQYGIWLIAWIAVAIIITWPKFPKEIVPDFLNGMREQLDKLRS